jgi:endonuclease/exonuclease/phosphatase family metal-dependent hydrolase
MAIALAAISGCASTSTYHEIDAPRYAGSFAGERSPSADAALRIVTFNIERGRKVAEAVAGLGSHPDLRGADLLFLQEMDAPGVEAIARQLGLNYVYYPASREKSGQDIGNAILSPWPIDDSHKLLQPHTTRIAHRARAAVSARVAIRGRAFRVYSLHLGSPLGMSGGDRRDQAAAVLADAETSTDPVIIAGDFNSSGIGEMFEERGYFWPTRSVGKSVMWFSFDHVFVRGVSAASAAGVAREVDDASDHRPVWVRLRLLEAVAIEGRS